MELLTGPQNVVSRGLLTNNRCQLERSFSQISIALDYTLYASGIAIDSLGEHAPSQLLRYRHPTCELFLSGLREAPIYGPFAQKPSSSAFAGNLQHEQSTLRRIDITIKMWECSNEAIENRMI